MIVYMPWVYTHAEHSARECDNSNAFTAKACVIHTQGQCGLLVGLDWWEKMRT